MPVRPADLIVSSEVRALPGWSRAATWAEAAAALGGGTGTPTAGVLAGAAAIQAASARVAAARGGTGAEGARDAALCNRRDNPALACMTALTPPPAGGVPAPLRQELRGPVEAAPASLEGQIAWVAERWAALLDDDERDALLRARDLLDEERRSRLPGPGPPAGPAPPRGSIPPLAIPPLDEPAWMRDLVLVAKHTRVWLHQLSRRFGRDISTLDRVPDEALRELADQGFTGLWLIGVWERSPASREIKRRRGDVTAEASAYAVRDYRVAAQLGGDGALADLRDRAASAGLRLGADLVPNHMGIDADWVAEHPEWFLGLPEPPFPGYAFTGPDLSGDPRITVQIEDGYWHARDAAVVFRRIDRRPGREGQTRFVYHGNDGTAMPWNDTAQLDHTRDDVRRALIDAVVRIARDFPILRFDAAMTLARRHVRRLWHPRPGEGGAIPSRSEQALPEAELDRRMPREFWAELVERVRREAPGTLLLAEAFWMMEAVFVGELGLNRVYQSAFMHMLRDEDNARFQAFLRATLAAGPALLERYVIYASNPDEAPAAVCMGGGDKLFGVATLMATLPGLPMFGHGQVEGLREQYGMEFDRPRTDEAPDPGAVGRHMAEIAPLLRQRGRFASAAWFRLLPVRGEDGGPLHAVYAYANRRPDGSAPSLVVYNHSGVTVVGRLEAGATLQEALGVDPSAGLSLTDARTGATYLRGRRELADRGLGVVLAPWQAHVFLDVRPWDEPPADLDVERAAPPAPGVRPRPERGAGLLLHVSSLPGPEGIGTLGAPARRLLEWLGDAGLTTWQVLPLCPGGPGWSPYSSPASRIGDARYIDLDDLCADGLLTPEEAAAGRVGPGPRVDHDAVGRRKAPLLAAAAARLVGDPSHPLHDGWRRAVEETPDLPDAALFFALHAAHGDRPWWEWPGGLRGRDPAALAQARQGLAEAVRRQSALAYLFDVQWGRLRDEAAARGVRLLGDVPLYVAWDSADVWADQGAFQLDAGGRPVRVAAVPPDAFAAGGQLWGNPVYDWERLAADGYGWWIRRFRRALEWTPWVRVDHFRGLAAWYSVERDAPDARRGEWRPGPGLELFAALDAALGPRGYVAEDLGDIDAPVHALRDGAGLLGTRVAQFGWTTDGEDPAEDLHRPRLCPPDTVLYTGTHDNDTTAGWWTTLDPARRARVARDLGLREDIDPAYVVGVVGRVVEEVLNAPSLLAMVPAQDLLALGAEHRMNVPATALGNWAFRLTADLDLATARRIAAAVASAGR